MDETRHPGAVGLCGAVVLLALAVGALVASSASAGTYYWCPGGQKTENIRTTIAPSGQEAGEGQIRKAASRPASI